MMSEKPIIFCGESVQAILDGRKTQTRRVIKPQPADGLLATMWYMIEDPSWRPTRRPPATGDTLWVREKWRLRGWDWEEREVLIQYADGLELWKSYPIFRAKLLDWEDWILDKVDELLTRNGETPEPNSEFGYSVKTTDDDPWQSPIYMPRWASRITLVVMAVRVERVQEISYEDILREGIGDPYKAPEQVLPWFAAHWDRLNGKKAACSFDDNPWIWVYEFKRKEVAD